MNWSAEAIMSFELPLPEIDQVHTRVREAFRQGDLGTYMASFAPDLSFRRPNGKLLSRDQLARSVSTQMARLVEFDSGFDRESASGHDGEVTEVGTQTAHIGLRVFLIFVMRWKVERHGQYTWVRGKDWVLRDVHIDRERITRAGFGLV